MACRQEAASVPRRHGTLQPRPVHEEVRERGFTGCGREICNARVGRTAVPSTQQSADDSHGAAGEFYLRTRRSTPVASTPARVWVTSAVGHERPIAPICYTSALAPEADMAADMC